MTRPLRRRALAKLTALLFLALGLAWYFLVCRGAEPELQRLREQRAEVESALAEKQSQLLKIRRIEAELEAAKTEPGRYMPSYSAEDAEVLFLNRILKPALNYTLAFHPLSRDGDQVRRGFSLDFFAASHGDAAHIIQQLETGPCRCRVGDISCSPAPGQPEGTVSVSLNAVFFETLVGGQADAGLP
ncbi:MAG: hypothetical protein IJ617_01630 [Oscillospiraceae bacterium]|nr:hypothetical protein [Oscillospiraceae bacterium]